MKLAAERQREEYQSSSHIEERENALTDHGAERKQACRMDANENCVYRGWETEQRRNREEEEETCHTQYERSHKWTRAREFLRLTSKQIIRCDEYISSAAKIGLHSHNELFRVNIDSSTSKDRNVMNKIFIHGLIMCDWANAYRRFRK